MKVDLSSVPNTDLIEDIIDLIKKKENIKAKKAGQTIEIKGLSSRKVKFYTKKILGQAELPGHFKVISQGKEGLLVHFKEFKT